MPRLSTRVLLSCAAISIVTGVLFVLTGALHAVVIATVPWLYGALIGLYFLPGAIAQGLFRLPGVAVVTILFAAVLTALSPVMSLGWAVFGPMALIGVLQELPYAVFAYRRRTRRVALIGATASGLLLGGVFAYIFEFSHGQIVLAVLQLVATTVSVLLFSWLGWFISDRLRAAGVGASGR